MRALGLFVLAVLVAISSRSPAADARPGDAAIAAFLERSAHDWNYGTLDDFMRGYENSPDTLYVSSSSVIHGYAAIRAHYASRYGNDRSSRGVLSFSDPLQRTFGSDDAVVVAHWHLALRDGGRLTGIFSLVLHRSAAGWRIVVDHSP